MNVKKDERGYVQVSFLVDTDDKKEVLDFLIPIFNQVETYFDEVSESAISMFKDKSVYERYFKEVNDEKH